MKWSLNLILLRTQFLLIVCLLSLYAGRASAQSFADSLLTKPVLKLEISQGFTDIEVDNEGNLILLSPSNQSIHKFFAETAYDSSIVIGGKSSRSEGFLHPVKISATNRQNIYLLDDEERRILLLNTNLKVIQEIDFLSATFSLERMPLNETIYPISFDASSAGELFMVNQDNSKIYKINQFGEVESSFGGVDYGEGSLYNPDDVRVSARNFIFVSDTLAQEISVFDNFGVFRYTIEPETHFSWARFLLYDEQILLYNSSHMLLLDIRSGNSAEIPVPSGLHVRDAFLGKKYLYILTENEVHLYKR